MEPDKRGYSYDELDVGMQASFSKTISESDVYLFAGITGDFNPMHVNEQYAKTTRFGQRIVHGPLTIALAAPILGTKLPGLGTIALSMDTKFIAPVFFGDTVTVIGEVAEKLPKNRVRISMRYLNQRDELVAEGSVLVSPPKNV